MPRAFVSTLGVIIALAWLALWQDGLSPHAHFVSASHSQATHDAASSMAAPTFVGGWTVMTIAMMLPTSFPLITLFTMMVRDRPDRTSLVALVCLGYLTVWIAAGVFVYGLVIVLRAAAGWVSWLHANPWAIGSAVCVIAGVFQFSRIKYACLERCRSTFGFINQHWTGKRARYDAFHLGVSHGVFCVGCCWALMLVMIPVGAGHVGWMLVLGAVMALEKNVAWGRAIVRPVGLALILLGLTMVIRHQG
jgi:predicted metal-binding membrane protein